MPEIEELLHAIAAFHKAAAKVMDAKKYRTEWLQECQRRSAIVKTLLQDQKTRQSLDNLLRVVDSELADPLIAERARKTISHELAAFIKAEARLYQLTHVKGSLYIEIVEEVRPWIASNLTARFPKDAEEFASAFEHVSEKLFAEMKSSIALPRRTKKESREWLGFQIWRYSLGTLMTLGNIYFTYHQPALGGMGTTSVTVGAWYFGRKDGGPRKPARADHGNLSVGKSSASN